MKKKLIRKYARAIAIKGIGLRKDQQVEISAPTSASDFVEILVDELYKNNASRVIINWQNPAINKLKYKYQSLKTLKELPEYELSKAKYYYDNRIAHISISSPDPKASKGLNFEKLKEEMKVRQCLNKYLSDPYMASKVQWCVAAIPNKTWAKKVFPNMSSAKAIEALWDAILKANHIDEQSDPIINWQEHANTLHSLAKKLNDYNFSYLKYYSSNGTNFSIGLVKNHIWAGGSEGNIDDIPEFNPNMPTEEIFTMPHKEKVNGKVVSTKPLSYQGNLIEDFYLIFKDGKVVEAKAKKGQKTLDALLDVDEGSRMLGEVALVPYHSPISQSNILFYNTLFDENASCHLAIGNAYSMNIKDGTIVDEEKLLPLGYNKSLIHVDFMIGSSDLSIIGVKEDGSEVVIFKDGDYAI
ncbi:MAG: aminopeptidase [Erysipelotrichaceae bacterium]|nr:aminopeptidase [Erysipelotrichaceae bacterium]